MLGVHKTDDLRKALGIGATIGWDQTYTHSQTSHSRPRNTQLCVGKERMTERQTGDFHPGPQCQGKHDPAVADRAYSYLLQLRDLDNELMWTRSNIILLVQGGLLAILASQFEALADKHPAVLVAMSLFGLVTACFWWRITRGGSFWVDFWQGKLKTIEHDVTGNIDIFRNHPSREENAQRRSHFRRMGYVSTRKALITVTFMTIILWVLLCVYSVIWPLARRIAEQPAPADRVQPAASRASAPAG